MLTVIQSRRSLRNFLTYDLEWVPGTLRVRIVGVYDGQRYRYYTSVAEFLAGEMSKANRGAWFYAHAGGLADVQFVLEEIMHRPDLFSVEASFSGSSAIIVHVRRRGGRDVWHFVDSYWLFRDSLARIAKSIGREKTGPKALEGATQEQVREWYANVSFAELEPYNRNDCEILWEAIDRFEKLLLDLGGQLQMTIASCAMGLFRRRYLQRDIGTHQLVNKIGRQGYFASRVEVFHSECTGARYYDINSSFPHSMTKPAPGELKTVNRKLPTSPADDRLYMADCTVTVPDTFLPPLPMRAAGKLFFPTGKWRSWFTGIDLELLEREGGTINRVHEVYHFEAFTDLRDYILHIYALRKATNDPAEKLTFKYLLNTLYGKFGERREKERMHILPDEKTWARLRAIYDVAELDQMRLMPGVFCEVIDANVAHEHVPISAYIVSRSRLLLYDHLAAGRDYYYCDTDGFATTDEYATTDELGGLKLEKQNIAGQFIAPKVYQIRGDILEDDGTWREGKTIVKAKGFSLGKGEEAIERFSRLARGEAIEIERMIRIKENLKKGITRPSERKFPKKLQGGMTKRFYYPDGLTRPWTVEELEGLT